MMLAVVGSGVYKTFLLLHILCVIVGFGGVLLNPIYGKQARQRGGREGLAVSESNFQASSIAEFVIYAAFVFGLITAIIGDPVIKFSQGWLSASMLLFIVAVVIVRVVLVPSHKKINVLMAKLTSGGATGSAPPEVAELDALHKRLAQFGGLVSLIFLVILYLMVFKPGGFS